MTKSITVGQLLALKPGKRVSDGQRAFWRKNADETLSLYQRVVDAQGGERDELAERLSSDPTRESVTAAREAAARIRARSGTLAPRSAPRGAGIPDARLGHRSTLGDVWLDMLKAIEVTGRWTERNLRGNKLRIEKHIKPTALWKRPIVGITAADLYSVLLPLRAETPDQERKITGLLRMAFTHARPYVVGDPVGEAKSMLDNVAKAKSAEHFPALLELPALRKLAQDIMFANVDTSVRAALLVQAHTAQRTTEVLGATWKEFDLPEQGAGRWVIPRERMKIKDGKPDDQELILPAPLTRYLRTLPRRSDYVFPNASGEGPISGLDKTMRETLGQAGKHVPHSWRASVKTLTDDAADTDGRPLFANQWLDALLDHAPPTKVKAAYARKAAVAGAGRVLAWWCEQLGVLS